jgi:hypothetical protein
MTKDLNVELNTQKQGLDAKIALLKTPNGAETFIAERITACQTLTAKAVKPTPASRPDRITMRDYLLIEKERAERFPEQVIEKEISVLEKQAVDLEKQLHDNVPIPPVKEAQQ